MSAQLPAELQDVPLLRTKLYVPPARGERVSRSHLLERLDAGLSCKLILVSAPAGFGKTTLVSEWVQQNGYRVAWVSLDETDNDLTRFWTYVIAALQTVEGSIGQDSVPRLQSLRQPALPQSMFAGLVNEISAVDAALVLVLDDFHVITEPEINKGLIFFLDHLPRHLHVVLLSRADPPWPLARMRARGEMIELRTEDLRFSVDEAAMFLNAVMDLGLADEDVVALDARTEGWVAGLQLAALSMQGRRDTAGFVQAFSGSHRFVLDYLVEEVLVHQSSAIRDFLVKTSILDRFNSSLCDAVLDDPEIDSQNMLVYLERVNLFLVPLDDERQWYRYHHLFADLLRSRLERTLPDQVPGLYRQASDWCEQAGNIDESISYALTGCHYERAADLLLHYGVQMSRRGMLLPQHRWLSLLPEDVILSRPRLCLRYGWTWLLQSLETAEQWAEAAERALESRAVETDGLGTANPVWLDSSILRANIAHLRGDGPQEILDLVQRARERLPQDQELPHGLTVRLAEAYKDLGQDKVADKAYVRTVRSALTCGHYSAALQAVCGRVMIARRCGRLSQAVEIGQQAMRTMVELTERSGETVSAAGLLDILLGRILLEWNELTAAEERLTRGLARSEPLRGHMIHSMGRVSLARVACAKGRVDESFDLDDLSKQPWSAYADYVAALLAWIAWMRAQHATGGPESIPQWTQAVDWAEGRPLTLAYQDYLIRPQFLQVRLCTTLYREHGQTHLEPIVRYIEEQFQILQDRGWTELMIDASIVQAMALRALGCRDEALQVLARALTLAKPERWVRIFVDEGPPMAHLLQEIAARGVEQEYANRLLSVFDADRRARTERRGDALQTMARTLPTLIEPLSERERQVLRLLPTDLTSTEIAHQLYVSKNTVRTHISHIYDKLGVHSREDAVQRAKELGLL